MNAQLRSTALAARRSLSEEERNNASRVICDKLINSPEFRSAETIACYFAMPDEVDLTVIIQRAWRAKKRIFCPLMRKSGEMDFLRVTVETELVKNSFGILEPVSGEIIDPESIDLVCTPLVAFDHDCNRIGMGGGYYDRHFEFLNGRERPLRPKLIGLAFDCQKVEKIRPNPWDIRLYRVLTELNSFACDAVDGKF